MHRLMHRLAVTLASRATVRRMHTMTLAGACALLLTNNLQAQTVYRIVGPDGRVTFSDKPPQTPSTKVTPVDNTSAAPSATPGAALPFELRRVVNQFPVTLYSASACAPCDQGRQLLRQRGVPFTEKTVTSAQDAQALQNLSGNTSVPFLTIGAQQIHGFSAAEWTQYLNAAAYPETSKLPANYRAPATAPLVAPEKAATPANKPAPDAKAIAPATQPPVAPPSSATNPAGIQF